MSGISGINNSLRNVYSQMASGRRINSAADDAAGMKIAQKQKSIVGGLDVGSRNLSSGQSALAIADGAMGSITDSLQRLRELALEAQNSAIYGSDDMDALKDEATQLMQDITDISENTNYNRRPLLNGTTGDLSIAASGNGDAMRISGNNSSLAALGIDGLDITSADAVSRIDDAINRISSNRSQGGATANAFDHAQLYNSNTSLNLVGATSKLEDLDYAKATTEKKKLEILQEYTLHMQNKRQQQQQNTVNRLLSGF